MFSPLFVLCSLGESPSLQTFNFKALGVLPSIEMGSWSLASDNRKWLIWRLLSLSDLPVIYFLPPFMASHCEIRSKLKLSLSCACSWVHGAVRILLALMGILFISFIVEPFHEILTLGVLKCSPLPRLIFYFYFFFSDDCLHFQQEARRVRYQTRRLFYLFFLLWRFCFGEVSRRRKGFHLVDAAGCRVNWLLNAVPESSGPFLFLRGVVCISHKFWAIPCDRNFGSHQLTRGEARLK